jgi:hypothetical protein
LIGGYVVLSGGFAGSSHFDDPHFTVLSVSSQPFFPGESVVVKAVVGNDEPMQEIAVPTTVEMTITPEPDDTEGLVTVTAVPTTIFQTVSATGSHFVTARLSGDQGIDMARSVKVMLKSDESKALSFDFGQVPAGSYVVTVTAPSYNNSTMSLPVHVYPTPVFGEWTETGDVAFRLVNLGHDSVDVEVRNSGEHTVVFSGSQYAIFVNTSQDYGAMLQGMGQTIVSPGKTVMINAGIPIQGSYYLDYFAIKTPDRTAQVKIPVEAWMSTVL